MKKVLKKITMIKEFNFKIKLLSNLELNSDQINRINKLLFIDCKNKEELKDNLYFYKRKIIDVLKVNLEFEENLVQEENHIFLETKFFYQKNDIFTLHSPLNKIKNFSKTIHKLIKKNILLKEKFYLEKSNINFSKKEKFLKKDVKKILDNLNIKNIEDIRKDDWIIVRNRNLRILKRWDLNYKTLMKWIFNLHKLINEFNINFN